MRPWMWWTVAAVCAATGIGLLAFAVLGDLENADKIASVTGAVVALAGVPLTLLALRRSVGGNEREVRVRAEQGGIAAAGSITAAGTAPGDGGVYGVDKRDVRATGPGSIAAGGDIVGLDLNGERS
ncbi:hypothetical protein [Kitasatospora putterlickiae]|uniref:hypothetical protein n=1 Tax=Kitasatospora putterlickiae TaxID=221725 RepID=UPI0031DCF590